MDRIQPQRSPEPPSEAAEDLIYISMCSGGVMIKIRGDERPRLVSCSRTTYYLRRCNLGRCLDRTGNLVEKLNAQRDARLTRGRRVPLLTRATLILGLSLLAADTYA